MKYKLSRYATIHKGSTEILIDSPISDQEITLNELPFIREFENILEQGGVNCIETELTNALAANNILYDAVFPEEELVNGIVVHKLHSVLMLTIMPTEVCNFRCVYCYEKFPDFWLKAEHYQILFQFIKDLVSRDPIDAIVLSWFGGEPLLALADILAFSGQVKAFSEEKKLAFNSSVTTNGYLLTPDVAQRLKESGVTSAAITLDGGNHDNYRQLANGEGTSEVILRNIHSVLNKVTDFEILLRRNMSHVDFEDYSFYNSFIDYAGNSNFSIYARPIGQWGDEIVPEAAMISESELSEIMRAHNARIKELGIRARDTELAGSMLPFSRACYASYPNGFVIRANGKIVKCTLDLDEPYNHVGDIDLENHCVTILDQNDVWSKPKLESDCHACAWLFQCYNNACPKTRITDPKHRKCYLHAPY